MSTPEHNAAALRDFIEAVWNQGDSEAADCWLAPRYTIHHDPGDPWDGRDLMAQDDRVIITWHWQATHLGEFPGFPPTGQTIRMSGATVYHFVDGRIAGHWQVTDRLGVYFQLQQAASR